MIVCLCLFAGIANRFCLRELALSKFHVIVYNKLNEFLSWKSIRNCMDIYWHVETFTDLSIAASLHEIYLIFVWSAMPSPFGHQRAMASILLAQISFVIFSFHLCIVSTLFIGLTSMRCARKSLKNGTLGQALGQTLCQDGNLCTAHTQIEWMPAIQVKSPRVHEQFVVVFIYVCIHNESNGPGVALNENHMSRQQTNRMECFGKPMQ